MELGSLAYYVIVGLVLGAAFNLFDAAFCRPIYRWWAASFLCPWKGDLSTSKDAGFVVEQNWRQRTYAVTGLVLLWLILRSMLFNVDFTVTLGGLVLMAVTIVSAVVGTYCAKTLSLAWTALMKLMHGEQAPSVKDIVGAAKADLSEAAAAAGGIKAPAASAPAPAAEVPAPSAQDAPPVVVTPPPMVESAEDKLKRFTQQ